MDYQQEGSIFSSPSLTESLTPIMSQDNIPFQSSMDTQESQPPELTFSSFLSEITDTLLVPSNPPCEHNTAGDDLVTFIERFSKEIQEPTAANQNPVSEPTTQTDSSQFLLASFVGHGSTSDLLEPLLSPGDFVSEKLLSDVLFQESDICMDSNLPDAYPGSESNNVIQTTDSTEDIQTYSDNVGSTEEMDRVTVSDIDTINMIEERRGNGTSEEANSSDSESEQSDLPVSRRITRSQAIRNKPQTKKPEKPEKPPPKKNKIIFETQSSTFRKYNTRSSSKYRIETRSSRNRNKFRIDKKPILNRKVNTNKIKSDLKLLKMNLSTKKIETPIIIPKKQKIKNEKNKIIETPTILEEDTFDNKEKEEIINEEVTKEISTPEQTKNDNTNENTIPTEPELDDTTDIKGTDSNSKMFDVKIALVPCSPRTPKKQANDTQVTPSPVRESTNQTRCKLQLTTDDTYKRYIPPLPTPPTIRKRGRPRKIPVPLSESKRTREKQGMKINHIPKDRDSYMPSSSDHSKTDSESEERDRSYGLRTNRPRTYIRRNKPLLLAANSADQESDEDVSEDDLISGESQPLTSYSIYRPSRLKLGYQHPDPIVETSSLSSVEPPNIWFDLTLPKESLATVCLSDMQLEAIVYASQQHCNILSNGERAGFLIGDGAGVGKGRIIAGIIYQNYLEGRKKGLWLSVSNDLRYDAMRDLRDIGANRVSLHALNKFKYGKISGKRNGNVKKGIVFATYSSLISGSSSSGKYKTRLSQILHWLGPHFEGVIILDECHRAKNLYPTSASMKPSKTGNVVLELQRRLPKARIVYCSATGASEPKHMAYMVRLGLWGSGTQFQTFQDFIRAVEKGGVGAMELVAMDMKLRGLYVSRQLSFSSVQFQIQEVPLTQAYIEVYNISCKFWFECKQKFLQAMNLLIFDNRKVKIVMALFWAAHQRFFKYLCIASKVQGAVRLAKKALRDNKCVVIGLQSTGESRIMDVLEERGGEISEFVSSAKGVLVNLIQKHFPAPYCSDKKDIKHKQTPIVSNTDPKSVPGDVSDSPADSNPDRDSALESDGSDNSNSDTSEENWETVPAQEYGDRAYARYISSSNTSAGSEEDLNPFSKGSVPWLATKKTKKLKLDVEEASPPKAEHSIPVAKEPEVSPVKVETPNTDPRDVYHLTKDMRQDLLKKVEEIGVYLPNNTLDELIDCLGGPSQVSEMTGRKGRVVTKLVDSALTEEMVPGIKYELRSCLDVPIDLLNMEEKRRFMDGEVNIAIISEAASSGISLHADKRYKNQKQRLHITLELPWTADKAIQQFGRTHRSNQALPPQYLFLISELAGERRFASVIARRLESLGALTRGDRKATSVESNDFSRYHFDTRDGLLALDSLLRSLTGRVSPLSQSLATADQSIVQAGIEGLISVDILSRTPKGRLTLDKETNTVAKFLNRILGIEVHVQNKVFEWFLGTFDFLVKQAKRLGRWDDGIVEMGTNAGEEVERIKIEEFLGDPLFGTGTTRLSTIRVRRGLSWDEVLNRLPQDNCTVSENEGLYLSLTGVHGKYYCLLVLSTTDPGAFVVYRPNIGRVNALMRSSDLQQTYRKVTLEEAKPHWIELYRESLTKCRHKFLNKKCRFDQPNNPCEVGLRSSTKYVLSGSVLGVWSHLCKALTNDVTGNFYIQVVRIYTTESEREVGILIPTSRVDILRESLEKVNSEACGDYQSITVTDIGTNEMEIETMDIQNGIIIEKPSSDSEISS